MAKLEPRLSILQLYEKVEMYLKLKGEEEMRKEVTQMRANLGNRLMNEVIKDDF